MKKASTLSVFNNKGNKVKVCVPKDDHDRETEHQLRKLRMSFFVAELAILSKKYGIAIQSTGGVHFADFDAIEYDNDPSSGDLHYFYTLK